MRRLISGWMWMLGLVAIGLGVQPAATLAQALFKHYQEQFEWQTDMWTISALAWSPDSKLLAATGLDGNLRIWDASNGHVVSSMRVYSGPLHSLDWGSDSNALVTGGNDGTIRMWDVQNGREVCIFMGHGRTLIPGGGNPSGVSVVRWSPDGKIIASGGFDGTVRLWSTNTATPCNLLQPLIIPTQHPYPIRTVDWNAASDEVLSLGLRNILPIWNAKTGEKSDEIECPSPYSADYFCTFESADWSLDGKYITASGNVGEGSFSRIWDVKTKESRDLFQMCTLRFNWSPKGYALVGWCDGQLQMFDDETLQMIGTTDFAAGYWEQGQDHVFNTYAISPDESHIAISYQPGTGQNSIIQMFSVSPNGSG